MALVETAETVSCYWVGQVAIKQLEKLLWLIEKCSLWSLPALKEPQKDVSLIQPQLTRPLPWAFFLPMLVVLRVWREVVSFITVMCGGEPYTAERMVKHIQNQRRTLRAIKYHGIRYRRQQKQQLTDKKDEKSFNPFTKWSMWFNSFLFFKDVETKRVIVKSLEETESKDPLKDNNCKAVDANSDKNLENEDEDQWVDDDNDDEDGEDGFNADTALRELAMKVEELESDPEDSDYVEKSVDEVDTSDSSNEEEEDEEELMESTESNKDVKEEEQNNEKKDKTNENGKRETIPESLVTDNETGEEKQRKEIGATSAYEENVKKEHSCKKGKNQTESPSKANLLKNELKSIAKFVDEIEKVRSQNMVEKNINVVKTKECMQAEINVVQQKKKVKASQEVSKLCGTDVEVMVDKGNKITNLQVEHVAQKVQTSIPVYKSESTNLTHIAHKSQPIHKDNCNLLQRDHKTSDSGVVNSKTNLETNCETFLETEKHVSKTASMVSKRKDIKDPSVKQQTSVGGRAPLKSRHKKIPASNDSNNLCPVSSSKTVNINK